MNKTKNIVIGLGEIGKPLLQLLSKKDLTLGYDINPKMMNIKKFQESETLETRFLHVCIPFTINFEKNIIKFFKKFHPKIIVIHSTIKPNTTKIIQQQLPVPVIYSATRGVHKRMISDMKKYVKFFSLEKNVPNNEWASKQFVSVMKRAKIKTKKMSNPLTLELAKIICDTSYLGWLINYAQISNMIAKKHNVNYDEMWSFSDEVHKFLGNRPKMYPGFIGGHCVIPNLDLIHNQTLDLIKQMNNNYLRRVKNAKSINKRYIK